MPANLKDSAMATGLEKVSFHSNTRERQCQRMLKLLLVSHASKVILKVPKLSFSSMWTVNFHMFKLDLENQRNQRSNCQHLLICLIIKKAREFQKNIYFCFIDYAKSFDCVDQNKLWKILKDMGIPDHLACFLGNLYAGQETTVRTWHGTTDWL